MNRVTSTNWRAGAPCSHSWRGRFSPPLVAWRAIPLAWYAQYLSAALPSGYNDIRGSGSLGNNRRRLSVDVNRRPMTGHCALMGDDTSLLERMIERLVTQRACLDRSADLVAELTGPVVELGLGKARTYDHLRRLFPHRHILVFDREIHAPSAYVPDRNDLYLGDFRDTLRDVFERLQGRVALLHADIGSADRERDRRLVDELTPLIDGLMRERGVVVTDREMRAPNWEGLPLPATAGNWSYYMYRVDKRAE